MVKAIGMLLKQKAGSTLVNMFSGNRHLQSKDFQIAGNAILRLVFCKSSASLGSHFTNF